MSTPICDHPNWVADRSANCRRRTWKRCEYCDAPTCGMHLDRDRDGRLCCRRYRCVEERYPRRDGDR